MRVVNGHTWKSILQGQTKQLGERPPSSSVKLQHPRGRGTAERAFWRVGSRAFRPRHPFSRELSGHSLVGRMPIEDHPMSGARVILLCLFLFLLLLSSSSSSSPDSSRHPPGLRILDLHLLLFLLLLVPAPSPGRKRVCERRVYPRSRGKTECDDPPYAPEIGNPFLLRTPERAPGRLNKTA